jgi:hypothetical protein
MSPLIHRLEIYKGCKINDCIDAIIQVSAGYSVNVMDPTINIGPIDNNNHRLNVKTEDGIVKSFSIG